MYIVESYHLMPIFGVKYDKFVTMSQEPTIPYGIPPFIVFWDRDNPQNKYPCKNVLQECENFTWRVTDCEELVGILLGGVSDCEELVGVTWSVSVSVKN